MGQWDQEPWTLVYGSEVYCEVPRTVHYVADSCGTKVGKTGKPQILKPQIRLQSSSFQENYSSKLQSLMSFNMC